MSTMSRQTAKNLQKTISEFENLTEMVARAVHPTTPSLVKTHPKNHEKLDEIFLVLCYNWKLFKKDLGLSDSDFNKVDEEGAPVIEFNDEWMKNSKEEYYVLIEKSEEKLTVAAVAPASPAAKDTQEEKFQIEAEQKAKQEKKLSESLSNQLGILNEGITASIDRILTEVRNMVDGEESPTTVQFLRLDLQSLADKIDGPMNNILTQYIGHLSDSETEEKENMRTTFSKKEKLRIDQLLLKLAKKVKEPTPAVQPSGSHSGDRKEQVFLKKTDPPKWDGDPITFADFVRKWKSQVSKANLPPENELDRLRESIPAQASKALFGESVMAKAWKILENLYGDKDLIANMLKTQLKNIKAKGKVDYDVVIEMVTDVNNIVLRLKALDMENMLHVDNEFLSAVYRVLPSNTQSKWLEFDKSCFTSNWAGFMKFL